MKKYFPYFVAVVSIIGSALFIYSTPSTKKTNDDYIIKAIKTPEGINFAGEQIPVYNNDVKERIDKELLVNTYWQSNSLLLIKRAHKYFPIIEPILAKYQIPEDFKYLAVIESGLENVSSPAGAKGFWQIMPDTAKDNGLEVNDNVDERYHLEKATEAACKYILKAKKALGSWTHAAASYNIGVGGLNKRQKEQFVDNYYDIYLPTETARYVPRIVAIKEILSQPYDYGFSYDIKDLYYIPKYQVVKIDSTINSLPKFAKHFNTNYKELKLMNPWLRDSNLKNPNKVVYELKIPLEEDK